jgi:hypothetical protein
LRVLQSFNNTTICFVIIHQGNIGSASMF